MNIKISSQITIEQPSNGVEKWVREHLIVDNPEYIKKQRMGFWTGNTPPKLHLYERRGKTLIVPYGCVFDIADFKEVWDACSLDFNKNPPNVYYGDIRDILYDYQLRAVTEAYNAAYGIIQAPAGSGKTQMALALAMWIGKRTLWITHTHDLLTQSKERAERYINKNLIGTITEGKIHLGEGITFATVQTLSKIDLTQYRDYWDTIIVDECHRAIASPGSVTMFSKVLNNLAARHKYGLSATVHRADGLIKATHALLGPIVAKVTKEDVAGKIMPVSILPRFLNTAKSMEYLDTDGTIVYSRLITYLSENEDRNAAIVDDLIKNAYNCNLILSDRLNQLSALMSMLPPSLREQAVMIDGKMTSKKAKMARQAALENMRSGEKRFLFATYALAREGLDVPPLDRLYLATPQKDAAVIEQSVGRIARTSPGKNHPIAYDYVDGPFRNLVKMYKRRCTTYKKLGCPIISE